MFIYNFVIFIFCWCTLAFGYEVKLTNDGPLVRGGVINFSATVYDDDKHLAQNEKFEFNWEDDAIPRNTRDVEISGSVDTWSVTYNRKHPAGEYVMQVEVKKCVVWDVLCYSIGSGRTLFKITEQLNGELQLLQHNQTREAHYVANNETVVHFVDVKKSDLHYISQATTVLTYWLVDCTYYGISMDFKFPYNYSIPEENHLVEALVVADFTPPPPTSTVAPTTTTTTTTTVKPNTTTIKTTTTPKPTEPTTTAGPKNITVPTKAVSSTKAINKRSIIEGHNSSNSISKIMRKVNGTLVPYNVSLPFVCNGSHIVTDSNRTYGYFSKRVIVKAPLSQVNITGNTWLQPGNLLMLNVKCSGSKKIEYCVQYETGNYNVTGNETCFVYLPIEVCDFNITRFLSHQNRTLVIILRNDVSKVVRSVFVNIYKVNKQTQLSVIVVPVAFSLVAVVLIIFGVAYYIQNRSRFIVEVADFNFGQQLDIEYKTFRERLRDSVSNAFMRAPSPSASTSEVPVWPPGQKYGSMT